MAWPSTKGARFAFWEAGGALNRSELSCPKSPALGTLGSCLWRSSRPGRVGESIATERCPNTGDSARVHHGRARVLCTQIEQREIGRGLRQVLVGQEVHGLRALSLPTPPGPLNEQGVVVALGNVIGRIGNPTASRLSRQ